MTRTSWELTLKKSIRSNLGEQNKEVNAERRKLTRQHAQFANSRRVSTLTKSAARRSAAPNLGWRVRKTPGAEGTALLLVGQKPATRPSSGPHPATMTTLKSITAHHTQASARPRPCGFRAAPTPRETA